MKTFEIWDQASNSNLGNAVHILEADRFNHSDGVYFFFNEENYLIHAIVSTPGMLVRTAKGR
jgi:hypothetical protein